MLGGKPMLFRKKIERSCTYCRFAAKLNDSQVLCAKKGIVDTSKPCRKFRYDPCKRIPLKAKAIDFSQYEQNDFQL